MTEADPAFSYRRTRDLSSSAPTDDRTGDVRDDRPPRSTVRSAQEARELEHRVVLAEIDAIHHILGVTPELLPNVPSSPPEPEAPPSAPSTDVGPRSDSRGAESPYLEDRLAAARAAADGISSEFEAVQQRTVALGTSVAILRDELSHAAEELAFLRSEGGFDEPSMRSPRSDSIGPPVARDGGRASAPSTVVGPKDSESPPYNAFTVSRYNETVREVRRRRPRLFGTTLLLAAAISAVLVFLAYRADEAMPVWWLAGLPLVWMIPVPFFVVSFVATHRILADRPFDLPEAT